MTGGVGSVCFGGCDGSGWHGPYKDFSRANIIFSGTFSPNNIKTFKMRRWRGARLL